MEKKSPSTRDSQKKTGIPSEMSENKKWDERKFLILAINPKIEAILKKIDPDYFELFSQMGTFQGLQERIAQGSSEDQIKKTFFDKNYEKILIHFLEHLFDFELQTLHFTQKHQTILSFGEWIENQVVFELPDGIRLLNIKKSQNQDLSQQKSDPQKGQNFKRPLNQEEEKKESKAQQIGSSNKKIVIQDQEGVKIVKQSSKQLKNQQKEEKNKSIEKYRFSGSLIVDHEFAKRQIKKVNVLKSLGSQSMTNQSKAKKKTKKELSNCQSNKKSRPNSKSQQKTNGQYLKKIVLIQQIENAHEVIVLETSDEKSVEKILEDENKIQVFGSDDGDKRSQLSNCKIGSISSRDDPGEDSVSNKKSPPNGENNNITNPALSVQIIMDQIARKQKNDANDPEKQIKRKLHQFRAKLSCLFKYSEKRFYIFPDFAPDIQDIDSNQKIRNRRQQWKRVA